MRIRILGLAVAVAAALVLVGLTSAEPGGKKGAAAGGAGCNKDQVGFGKLGPAGAVADKDGNKGGQNAQRPGGGRGGPGGGPGAPGGGFRGGRGVDADQIVERIMALDKNKDGKITKDELPERMQDLIAKGDTNKDGALDKDEIKKLAADLAQNGGFGGFGRGGFGPGGFGGGGFGGGFGPPGPGRGPGGGAERALADLNLKDKKKESAEAAVKAYQENVKKLTDLARSDLLVKMKDVLSEEEFKKFKEALDRPAGPPAAAGVSVPADVEKKLDALQKDLEELRRQLKR